MLRIAQRYGCQRMDLPSLIPAAEVLRLYGERAHNHAFVFDDRTFGTLCLRPDFTAQLGRHFLQSGAASARYAMGGMVFGRAEEDTPAEEWHFGFEFFGEEARIEADIEALELTLALLSEAGITPDTIELGDMGLIDAALSYAALSPQQTQRLRRHYWRSALLQRLLESPARPDHQPSPQSSPHIGRRPLKDIEARLNAPPELTPDPEKLAVLSRILGLDLPAPEALAHLRSGILKEAPSLDEVIGGLEERLAGFGTLIDPKRLRFCGNFASRMEYYTGFMFRIIAGGRTVAAGGRYGGVLNALGATSRIPAVGAVIMPDATSKSLPLPSRQAIHPKRPLILGVPSKGRLKSQFTERLVTVGLRLVDLGHEREYAARLEGIENVTLRLMSSSEMPAKLEAGEIDACITGQDLFAEHFGLELFQEKWKPVSHSKVRQNKKLQLSDASMGNRNAVKNPRFRTLLTLGFGHADLIVAVPACWQDVRDMRDLDDIAAGFFDARLGPLRVATKYFQLTRDYFERTGVVNYVIVESLGATEAAPAAESADVIVDITSSGATLRDNHLKIITPEPILASQAALFAAPRLSPGAQSTLTALATRLKGG